MNSLLLKKRPELKMGYFTHDNGNHAFFSRVRYLIKPSSIVVDFGAGRGNLGEAIAHDPRMSIVDLRSISKRVIGVDIDPVVLENKFVDEAHVINSDNKLPFDDNTIDLIFSLWVLEHIEHPESFLREIRRVLKPGGWFCAMTPNRWGYVGMAVTMIPNSLHVGLLKTLRPDVKSIDVFPTHYKMNTLSGMEKFLKPENWNACIYAMNTLPRYYGNNGFLFSLFDFWQRLAPASMRTDLMIFAQKV